MADACRDWLSTLWPASYKGVPFYFESDKEKGGRDNVKHQFPGRDDPFVEDMGESLRMFSGSAYVHGDDADVLASALKAALASAGPGPLVVPYFGGVNVHCESFERATARDQMGYVAFEVEFVRAGAATALISVPYLQNVAFSAAGAAATLIASFFPLTITSQNEPDFVLSAITDTLAGAASVVDVLRQTYPVEPGASARLRDAAAALIASAPAAVTAAGVPGAPAIAAAAGLVDLIRSFADALPLASAERAMIDLADTYSASIAAPAYLSPTAARAADNAAATSRLVRLAALTAYAEAVLGRTFTSRPEGVTARGEVAERFEGELYNTTGAASAPLYLAIEQLRGAVIEWLTRAINDLAPIITVESARVRSSLDLAWVLYADPLRAPELVARNQVRHPSFMPRVISAVSR